MLVSGGHSSLLLVEDVTGGVEPLGATIDDAAGEAFDKVARLLGLPFPGGPHIDRAAASGSSVAIDFPRGLTSGRDLQRHRFDFSFSGLKTAVARWVEAREAAGEPVPVADVAASFQEAVCDVLTRKAVDAAVDHGVERPADRRRGRGELPAPGAGRGAGGPARHPRAGAAPGAVHRQRRDGRRARRRDGARGAGRRRRSTSRPTRACRSPTSWPERASTAVGAGGCRQLSSQGWVEQAQRDLVHVVADARRRPRSSSPLGGQPHQAPGALLEDRREQRAVLVPDHVVDERRVLLAVRCTPRAASPVRGVEDRDAGVADAVAGTPGGRSRSGRPG